MLLVGINVLISAPCSSCSQLLSLLWLSNIDFVFIFQGINDGQTVKLVNTRHRVVRDLLETGDSPTDCLRYRLAVIINKQRKINILHLQSLPRFNTEYPSVRWLLCSLIWSAFIESITASSGRTIVVKTMLPSSSAERRYYESRLATDSRDVLMLYTDCCWCCAWRSTLGFISLNNIDHWVKTDSC